MRSLALDAQSKRRAPSSTDRHFIRNRSAPCAVMGKMQVYPLQLPLIAQVNTRHRGKNDDPTSNR